MLSKEEKQEMLDDARSMDRRAHFRAVKKEVKNFSFDEYITFLNSVQRIFSSFKISTRPTVTRFNKL